MKYYKTLHKTLLNNDHRSKLVLANVKVILT